MRLPYQRTRKRVRRYLLKSPWYTKRLYLRHEITGALRGNRPRQLWIGVTYRCQCSCVHCGLGLSDADDSELSNAEIADLLAKARRSGIMEVVFFGGEPLLRPDLMEMIKISHKMGFLTSIFTNGLLLEESKVAELKKSGLVRCNVSLDSAFPAKHDKLRGVPGCFDRAVEGIGYLRTAGIKVGIWTYVSRQDADDGLGDLRNLIRSTKELGAQMLMVLFSIASGKWADHEEHILTLDQREQVRELASDPIVRLEFPSEQHSCLAGSYFFYVSPHGDVSPCPTLAFSMGNIRDERFDQIFKRILESQASFAEVRGSCAAQSRDFRKRYCFRP